MTIHVFRSQTDIRALLKRDVDSGTKWNYWLVNANTGAVVKYFASDSDRDDYLRRNNYF